MVKKAAARFLGVQKSRNGPAVPDLEMLEVFRSYGYEKGVGPGVYDIHSPRVPPVEELTENLRRTVSVLDNVQVWVNPDCGPKTRRPEEVRAALATVVSAARRLRDGQGDDP